MASLRYSISFVDVALAANTPKVVAYVKAPANHRIVAERIVLGSDLATSGAPILVELCRPTTDGSGWVTTPTPTKLDPSKAETPQATVQTGGASSPPTIASADVVLAMRLHPQGTYDRDPGGPGAPIEIPGGGRFAVRLTSANACNVSGSVVINE